MSYKYNHILTSDISQNGGFNIMTVVNILILLVVLFLLYLCLGSLGVFNNTFLDPDTFLGGKFKDIKVENWGPKLWDKINPANWR
jgi:hypothetical protein